MKRVITDEVARRWVIALRSGNYKQGQGFLEDLSGGFCCLGVLADIEGWRDDLGLRYPSYSIDKVTFEDLPIFKDMTSAHFIEANDSQGLTFNQIADVIESKL